MMPITLLAFGAVEFHRYTALRSGLQDALDGAALAVARSSSTDAAVLQQTGEAVLRAQFPFSGDVTLSSFTVGVQNGAITADAQISVRPIVASLFMSGDLRVAGHSEVQLGTTAMEVALVLDTTYSMLTNNRLGITKTAANDFVDILAKAAADSGSQTTVKFGLVPFAATVNVGPAAASEGWMDRNALSPIHGEIFTTNRGLPVSPSPNRFTLLQTMGIRWAGCVESRPMPYDVQDAPPDPTRPESLFVPYFAPDEPDPVPDAGLYNWDPKWRQVSLQGFAYPNNYVPDLIAAVFGYNNSTKHLGYYWRDYQMGWQPRDPHPRDQIYGYAGGLKGVQGVADKYTKEGVDYAVAWPLQWFTRDSMSKGPNRGCTPKPLTRLTEDRLAVKAAINAMEAGGSTNIPMGLVWGWHLLSPNAPFSDGSAYTNGAVRKIAVLMTDGENSLSTNEGSDPGNWNGSEYSGIGYVWQNRIGTTSGDWTARRNAMDARLTQLCTNMKAKGVVLYTIRVEVTGASPDVLRNCATQPGMFFDVKAASELNATFAGIARSIQSLRIAK